MNSEELASARDALAEARALVRKAQKERDAVIARLAAEGFTYRELACSAGISVPAIGKIVREAGGGRGQGYRHDRERGTDATTQGQ